MKHLNDQDRIQTHRLCYQHYPLSRLSKRLQMCIHLSMIVTGQGKLRSYFHRFKIKESPQTADHLLWECELLRKQQQVLRNSIMKVGGKWLITNIDLASTYTKFFWKFVKYINFENLWIEHLTKHFLEVENLHQENLKRNFNDKTWLY
jgi:hypothetical protein